jgi:nickel/cobalt exporter
MRFRYSSLFLVLLFTSTSFAHPLTDVRYDRTAAVRFSAEGIEVTYTLEASLLAMHLDAAKRLTPQEISGLDRTASGYAKAYARKVAPDLIDKFMIQSDGTPIALKVTASYVEITDHAICRFILSCAWPPGGKERLLTIVDGTFSDHPGVLNLTLDMKGGSGKQVEVRDLVEPPARVRTRPLTQLTREEVAIARKAAAEIILPVAIAPYPHELSQGFSTSTDLHLGTKVIQPLPEPIVNADIPPAPDLFTDLSRRGLPALFDSTLGIGFLLLASFLFGAAHAFTPGHGKTLVAAYLIGERGTIRHAILLAMATTITHTGSVIAVATLLWSVYGNNVPGKTQASLQFIAGLLVLGVGLWLLLRRVTGQADHFHFYGGHHHHHDTADTQASHGHTHSHSHDHGHGHDQHGPTLESAKTTGGWLRLVLMGMGGGIVPCWDAVLLLIAATAMNRVEFAIPILLAFSLGLGVVLVGLGIGVVYAYKIGASRLKDHRWFQALPVASAALLIGVGFWLCKQAVQTTSQ